MTQCTATSPRRNAVDRLRASMLADWRTWSGRTWLGLARLERELPQRLAIIKDPERVANEFAETGPTLVRRAQQLCHQYQNLLESCVALKWELYAAAQPDDQHRGLLGRPFRQRKELTAADFAALRARAEQFLLDLEQTRHHDVKLILKNARTDIGGGD
jgi:hypothetical protein